MNSVRHKFSDDFVNQIFLASEGFLSSEELDNIFLSFQTEAEKYYFTSSSESNLIRIIYSNFDKISFLRDFLNYPHHIEIVTAIAANSAYLTDIVVRNPEYLYQVFGQDYLSAEIEENKMLQDISNALERYKSFNAKLNYLRLFKRRYLLKTGLNDILGNAGLSKTTSELSVLAKIINRLLFELSYEEILKKYNLDDLPNKYVLASLGKLGGDELNYSSDVDLIIFFDKNIFIEEAHKEYYEILSEAILLFIRTSTEMTGKGYLYRVDFRLRPDGKNSPLCRTMSDYLRYYEQKGEDWERQMLIKLNFVGGDKNLFAQFYNYLESFIYPSSFSGNILRQIKIMKEKIEENSGERNVKTFPGGIRDVEFSVQALQLINGGRNNELRTGNSLLAIERLNKFNSLNKEEMETLRCAYIFYRRIEHFMQLMNDAQTHLIPSDPEQIKKVASFLGFKNSGAFEKTLANYRSSVRKIFDSVVIPEENLTELPANNFRNINFKNPALAEKNINFLQNGTGLLSSKQFDSRTLKLFQNIEPALINFLSASAFPDFMLDNFTKFIHSLKIVSIWYKEFSNKNFLNTFLKLCETSERFVHQITFDKNLSELYLSGIVFQKQLDFANLKITQIDFILTVQFTLDLISVKEFSSIKKKFIEEKISQLASEYNFGNKNFIAALGSFGNNEMNFASDVDLIIVNSDESYSEVIQKECKNFLLEINKTLFPIKVDLRLRPEGTGSQLVWNLEEYKKYLSHRARIWEFQALTKIRFIKGNKLLFDEFVHSIISSLQNFDSEKIKSEINSIYDKVLNESSSAIKEKFDLKKSRGSLLDVQYLIQFLLLKDPDLLKGYFGKNSIAVLNGLKSMLDENIISDLIQNYKFYKMLELSIQTIFDNNNSLLPIDEQKQKRLSTFLKIENPGILRKKIDDAALFNHKIFNDIIGS